MKDVRTLFIKAELAVADDDMPVCSIEINDKLTEMEAIIHLDILMCALQEAHYRISQSAGIRREGSECEH